MATRFSEPTRVRKSLPLTERDLAELDRLRQQTPERAALARLCGANVIDVTESSLLHTIFIVGLHVIREQAEEDAYATAAVDRLASGEADETRRTAQRRRPSRTDED
jgi:hypothetical protein